MTNIKHTYTGSRGENSMAGTSQQSARQNISSGTKWEGIIGYSRAVRIGNLVWVAGTTAADENTQVVGVGDAYTQARFIFTKIERALKEAGASLEDVVRTRVFLVNADDWESVGRAHGEVFGVIRPASTMLAVKALIGPEYLLEIEVDACIGGTAN